MKKLISIRTLSYALTLILLYVQSITFNIINFSFILYFSISIGIFSLLDLGAGAAFSRRISEIQKEEKGIRMDVYHFAWMWYRANYYRVASQIVFSSLIFWVISTLIIDRVASQEFSWSRNSLFILPFIFSQVVPVLGKILNFDGSGHITFVAQSVSHTILIVVTLYLSESADNFLPVLLTLQYALQVLFMLSPFLRKRSDQSQVELITRMSWVDFKTQMVQLFIILNFALLNWSVSNMQDVFEFQEFQFNNRLMAFILGISSVIVLNRSMDLATRPIYFHKEWLGKVLIFSFMFSLALYILVMFLQTLEISNNIPNLKLTSQIIWAFNIPLQLISIYATFLFLLRQKFLKLFLSLFVQSLVLIATIGGQSIESVYVMFLSQLTFCIGCIVGLSTEDDSRYYSHSIT